MKKALSLILVLVMLLGMMPMQVFATEGTQETEAVEVVSDPGESLTGKIISLGDFAVAGVGTGALTASTTQLSQKTLMAVPYCGAELFICVNDGYQACVYSGNNNNCINQNSGWLGTDGDNLSVYTCRLPESSIYMRLSIRKVDGSAMTEEDLALSGLVVSYECTSDVVEDNSDVCAILQTADLPILIHISDIHGDIIRAERAAQFADAVGADALMASGDLTANQPDDWGNALFEAVGKYDDVDFVYGIGNHDAQNISASAYQETIYNAYFKENPATPNGETYYYRDLADQKLRLISVNQQEGASTTTSGGTCYSQAQVDWLVDTLKTTPAGYGVVLMYHSPETTIAKAGDSEYSEFFQVGNRYDNPTNSYSGYSGTFLMDLVDAFMLREVFVWDYSEKNGASPITLTADFTNVADGVEFIAHVTGHVHSDSITYLPGTTCKQLLLGVTCTTSMYGEAGGYYGLADYSDLNREADTANQDAFNAYVIDRENKTVRVLRVGAQQTVSGMIRDDMTIPYSIPFEEGDYLFDTTGLIQLDLSSVEWVNYGYQAYGIEPTHYPGKRWSANMIFDVPYEGVTFYIKINAPYEMGIRSGKTDTTMTTNYYWLNNKGLTSGNNDRGYVYTIPAGHEKFILSLGNITRNQSGNIINEQNPISFLELQAAGLEIWYRPEPTEEPQYPFNTEDKFQLDLSNVEWVNYGYQPYGPEPTYHVGTRLTANMIFDVPYDGVTFYIKIKAPYELGIRSGETDTTMDTNLGWLNNKFLPSGNNNYGHVYTIPAGHEKFVLTIGNVSRNSANNVSDWYVPITIEELAAAGLEIWYVPCNHTYEDSVCTNCGIAQPGPIITHQPESVEQEIGKKFAITVKAEGEGLTYQWYVKEAGAKAFKLSSNKTSSYAYTMQTYMHNRQVYCVITDANGNSVTTETATITRPPVALKIVAQPQDARVNVGEKFSISPKMEGEGLTYQWYYKNAGMKAFAKSSNRTSAYAYTMQNYMIGRQVYCVITDKYGNEVTTDVATISLPPVELKILTQPTDVSAPVGTKFSISFEVQGDGLTYQWYVKESGAKEFKVSSNKTSAYAYAMQSYMNNRQVYCVITDQYGNQVTTETVTIHVTK